MFKMYLFYMLFIFDINYNEYCILFVFVQNSDFVWREFYYNVEIYNYISIGVFSLVLVSIFLFFNISNYVLVKMLVKNIYKNQVYYEYM